MLQAALFLFLLLRLATTVIAESTFPFSLAQLALNDTSEDATSPQAEQQPTMSLLDSNLELRTFPLAPRKAQSGSNACASSYTQCPGMPSLCCPSNSQCLPDAVGMVGCCPNGAACTGIVSQQTAPSTTPAPAGAAGGGVATTSTAAAQGSGQVSVLGGALTATGDQAGQTIFAAAGRRRADTGEDGTRMGAGLALGIALGSLLIL